MSSDESGAWIDIGWTQTDLFEIGPSFVVQVRSPHGVHTVLAQIDTGATVSAISPSLFQKLGVVPHDFGEFRVAYEKAVPAPIVRAVMGLPEGSEVEMEFAVLVQVGEPHDVLIGRDFLRACSLHIDFIGGGVSLGILRRALGR